MELSKYKSLDYNKKENNFTHSIKRLEIYKKNKEKIKQNI